MLNAVFWVDDDWMIAIELINWEYFNSRISVVGEVILFLASFPWENSIVFGVFSCYYVINNEILMIRIFNIQYKVLFYKIHVFLHAIDFLLNFLNKTSQVLENNSFRFYKFIMTSYHNLYIHRLLAKWMTSKRPRAYQVFKVIYSWKVLKHFSASKSFVPYNISIISIKLWNPSRLIDWKQSEKFLIQTFIKQQLARHNKHDHINQKIFDIELWAGRIKLPYRSWK